MNGRDRGLQLVRSRPTRLQGLPDQGDPLPDPGAIPARPILVLEEDELATDAGSRVAPRIVQEHQGEQTDRLRLVRQERDQRPRKADRLAGQLVPDQGVPGRRGIPLVVDQVEHPQHAVEALGQHVDRRDAIGDPGIADLAFGPDQALGERRLGYQERARDLRRGQPAERPEREGDPGIHRQGGMTAREDEPEPIVLDGHRILLVRRVDGRELGLDRRDPAELLGLLAQPPSAAQSIDRPVARGGRDPGARVARDPANRPRLEGRDEGLLDDFFGQIEVAQDTDQRRDRPTLLLAEDALDDIVGGRRSPGIGRQLERAEGVPAVAWAISALKSTIGRTSMDPWAAPGIIAA